MNSIQTMKRLAAARKIVEKRVAQQIKKTQKEERDAAKQAKKEAVARKKLLSALKKEAKKAMREAKKMVIGVAKMFKQAEKEALAFEKKQAKANKKPVKRTKKVEIPEQPVQNVPAYSFFESDSDSEYEEIEVEEVGYCYNACEPAFLKWDNAEDVIGDESSYDKFEQVANGIYVRYLYGHPIVEMWAYIDQNNKLCGEKESADLAIVSTMLQYGRLMVVVKTFSSCCSDYKSKTLQVVDNGIGFVGYNHILDIVETMLSFDVQLKDTVKQMLEVHPLVEKPKPVIQEPTRTAAELGDSWKTFQYKKIDTIVKGSRIGYVKPEPKQEYQSHIYVDSNKIAYKPARQTVLAIR